VEFGASVVDPLEFEHEEPLVDAGASKGEPRIVAGESDDDVKGSRLLKAVEAIAIRPEEAQKIVTKFSESARTRNPNASKAELRQAVAKAIVRRYSRFAATTGAATALVGVIPGLGTVLAAVGGATADAAVSMKLQVDMCMCLAALYDYDILSPEGRYVAFLIAAGGTVEHAGAPAATQLASKAGVRLIRQYLRGAVLQAVKAIFKKLGIIFTRKALEKALPFGIGVVISSTANYALTTYVGRKAVKWFDIDAEMPREETGDDAEKSDDESGQTE
jgi:hypothetical protein